MRLYAKADTRFSLTAVWSSWSSGTLTKCCRNAFFKMDCSVSAPLCRLYRLFSNANWRAPFRALSQQLDSIRESQPLQARARRETAAPQRRSHPGRLLPLCCQGGGEKSRHIHSECLFYVNSPPPSPPRLSLDKLTDTAHLAQTTQSIHAVADTSVLHEFALEENKSTTGKGQQYLYLIWNST